MPFKMMKRRDFERWVAEYGMKVVKGKKDWKLVDKNGNTRIPNIIITHPGNEVVPESIKKTQRLIVLLGEKGEPQ